MSFSSKFKIIEKKGEHFILFEDFYAVLKEENRQLKQNNLRKTIQKYYHDKLEEFNCKEYVRVFVVLRYCFQHSESSKVCHAIGKQVTSCICTHKSTKFTGFNSSFELYRLISNTTFHEKTSLLDSCHFDEINIETLICEHKSHFTEQEWKKICWFESHFSKYIDKEKTYHDIEFEHLIDLKYSKFQSLLNFKDCQDKLNKLLPLNIKQKQERLLNTEKENNVTIYAQQIHVPYIIDEELKCILESSTDVEDCDIVSYDTVNSVKNNSICILIAFKPNEKELCYNDLCEILLYNVRKKHDCDIEIIHFVHKTNLHSYVHEDGSIARFQLRDDIENTIFSNFIYQWHSKSLDTSFQCENDSECLTCHPGNTCTESLAIHTFNLSSEWLLETPIEIQIILEAFLNRRSCQINKDSNYHLQKYQKLYQTFDVLQNVYNHKYIGLFQQKSTQELLIEYKNVKSVFEITSKSSATSSLKAAELKLKKNANKDMCYFNTYLKKYQVEYTNIYGEIVANASLRDCHIILMLDNLVRLQYVADPNPGENRSKQICTLPITLQGLPLDSDTTLKWHLADCDGSETCHCKQSEKLHNNDVQRVLLERDSNEQKMLTQFQQLMTWSNVRIWSKLTDTMLEYVGTGGVGCARKSDTPKTTPTGPDADGTLHIIYESNSLESVRTGPELESAWIGPELESVQAGPVFESLRTGSDIELARTGPEFQLVRTGPELESVRMKPESESALTGSKFEFVQAEFELEQAGPEFELSVTEPKSPCCESDRVQLEETEDDIDFGSLVSYLDMIGGVSDYETGTVEDMNVTPGNAGISELELSIGDLSITEDASDEILNYKVVQDLLSSFGFHKFKVPKLLCRHPPPALGRDDDITKIREILDDILLKMGYTADEAKSVNRILCGPDHKIGQCLLKLMNMDSKYRSLLPEFPLLHLRKSKINILFSAYKEAGIVQLVQFMKDDNQDDLAKLVSIQHIDVATRYVKRLALALHLAFMICFTQTLEEDQLESFTRDMETNSAKEAANNWSTKFEEYIQTGCQMNATFAMHRDMMRHCESVVAVALSERLGGPDGYALLLATIKASLTFSFVNNATSYAPYCVQLLYHHYNSGHFHRHLKETLYSTPFKGSTRNFASDTKREMDHLDVLKGFRSGSNTSSITCRMSLIDSLNETRGTTEPVEEPDDDTLGWDLTDVDISHILPATELIIRMNALSTDENDIPCNVYTKVPTVLPSSILDDCSDEVGKYLMYRYICRNRMFELTEKDIPDTETLKGTPDLVSRARRSTGITIKRTLKSKIQSIQTEKEVKEEKRKKTVAKESRRIDCLSSDNNACQALVKPDSSKPKVIKSIGMQRALKLQITQCLPTGNDVDIMQQYMKINMPTIPASITAPMKLCTVEFAGFKFKVGNVKTGREYIQQVENLMKNVILRNSLNPTVVICEEKYRFTPDDLKAGTRKQRTTVKSSNVSHLKVGSSIINDTVFNKDTVTKSTHGKEVVSTYLAEKLETLQFETEFTLIVDSQLHMTETGDRKQSHPVKCEFHRSGKRTRVMTEVSQRKGEAEMAVIDWMVDYRQQLKEGNSVVCLVTSGDIDAVCAHLYAVSKYWPRDEHGKFQLPVHVVLQKPRSKFDIYNITAIVELLESYYSDRFIGMKLAVGLCMGGNDFVPKFYSISHFTILQEALKADVIVMGHQGQLLLNVDAYVELIKSLYCPKRRDPSSISFDDLRGMTIGNPALTDPRKWLPPKTALQKMAGLIQLQIDYLDTLGFHEALLPDFISKGCLIKNESGVEFDFGPDAHFESPDELPAAPIIVKKRQHKHTPQKGNRKKRQLTSTPKK